jgi:hypothetical protein
MVLEALYRGFVPPVEGFQVRSHVPDRYKDVKARMICDVKIGIFFTRAVLSMIFTDQIPIIISLPLADRMDSFLAFVRS